MTACTLQGADWNDDDEDEDEGGSDAEGQRCGTPGSCCNGCTNANAAGACRRLACKSHLSRTPKTQGPAKCLQKIVDKGWFICINIHIVY